MSGAVERTERSSSTEPKSKSSVVWLAYGQIAAMLGAFSTLVFLTHFFDVGLKGVVREAFEGWVHYVRPWVGYPLERVINLLPQEWRFPIPTLVLDYVAVGITSFLGVVRMFPTVLRPPTWGDGWWLLTMSLLLWPYFLFHRIRLFLGTGLSWHPEVRNRWLGYFAPFIYLALLFAANFFLPALGLP